jgi:hypothetical protein
MFISIPPQHTTGVMVLVGIGETGLVAAGVTVAGVPVRLGVGDIVEVKVYVEV